MTVGDEIMRVNGINLRELSQRDVIMLLRKLTSGVVHLTVRPALNYGYYTHPIVWFIK